MTASLRLSCAATLGLLVCASFASAQTHLINATDFAVGSKPSGQTFADGFTVTFTNPVNAAVAPFTVVQTPAFGNSVFGNNTIYLDTSPASISSVEIDFNRPVSSFLAAAGVSSGGNQVNFDTKAYLGGTLVGDNNNSVLSGSFINVAGNFTFSGGSFDRVVIAPTFNPFGNQQVAESFGVTSLQVTVTPEPGNIAWLVAMSMPGAVFLVRRRKQARHIA